MVEVFGSERLIEGRLTGGFPYQKWKGREESPSNHPRAPELAHQLLSSLAKSPSAQGWADLGTLQLLYGEVSTALSSLMQAVKASPKEPDFLSDLAAAYIESARSRKRPIDWVNALEMADRALSLNSWHREALFNKAVALGHIRLFRQADLTRTALLLVEHSAGWSEEGLSQLQKVRQSLKVGTWDGQRQELETALIQGDRERINQIVSGEPRQARLLFDNKLILRWAKAIDQGDLSGAGRILKSMTHLSAAMASSLEDRLTKDIVDQLRMSQDDPKALTRFSHNILGMERGLQLYKLANYEEASEVLQAATINMEKEGSPLRFKARYHLACAIHYSGRSVEALEILTHLESDARQHAYRSLQGEILWMKGVASLASRQPIQAQASYSRALEVFQELGDGETSAGVENLIAELLDFQGANEDAWAHRTSALLAN